MKMTFQFTRDTKGAVRYDEVGTDGIIDDANAFYIGTLYIRKHAMPKPNGPYPEFIDVTVNLKRA